MPELLPSLVVRVYDNQQLVFTGETCVALELGRQRDPTEHLYILQTSPERVRLAIAPLNERSISRQHALFQMSAPSVVRITNLSSNLPIRITGKNSIAPGQEHEHELPLLLSIGGCAVRLQTGEPAAEELKMLAEATRAPGLASHGIATFAPLPAAAPGALASPALVRWLQIVMEVLQVAATAEDFYATAAQAIVDLASLDSGRVLCRTPTGWKPVAFAGRDKDEAAPASTHVLEKVRSDRRTFWQLGNEPSAGAASLVAVKSVVAAPILNRSRDVVAVLYGDRLRSGIAEKTPITELEARLVELLACGVAAGLARVEQETAAIAAVTRFEEFFTPALARRLAVEPDLLKGRKCQVTLLFCDIRGFSRISERLGAERTFDWVGDVMSSLSDAVLANQCVLVDYIGDELLAMWGAPEEQPDQARLACRAALQMMACLPSLNDRWRAKLGEPFTFGIGINSGEAHVGNTGSRQKFKYGPLGNTVNLASRVQGATKHLKCDLLVTSSTHAQLGPDFFTRRICRARVVNINEPVDLYEVCAGDEPEWQLLRAGYEAALAAFETADFRTAARTVGALAGQFPADGPILLLLARAAKLLAEGKLEKFEPVWTLTGK